MKTTKQKTTKKPSTTKAMGSAAKGPIVWPKEWATDGGFPIANQDRTPDGKHSWAETDAALRKEGSSLAERVEALGGPNNGAGGAT